MTITPEQTAAIAEIKSPWWLRLLPKPIRRQIEASTGLQSASDTLWWLVLDTAVTMGSSFVVSFLMARSLGPTQFGYFSYLLAFFSLFMPISKLGLANVVIRDLSRHKNEYQTILGTTFILRVGASLLTMLLTTLGMMILRPADSQSQILVSFLGLMTVFQAFEVIEYYYQSKLAVKTFTLAKIAAVIVSVTLKLTALYLRAPVSIFIGLWAVEAALLATAYATLYHQQHSLFKWHFAFDKARELLKQSVPLLFSSVVIMGYAQADQLFLNFFQGSAKLGQYAVALTILNGFSLLPVIIHRAVAPVIMQIDHHKRQQLFFDQLLQIYRGMTLLSLVVGIALITFGPMVITILYGPEYLQAGHILQWLPFRFFFVAFGVMRALFVVSYKLFYFDLLTNLVGVTLSIIGSIVLIPMFGVNGLLMASFISLFASTFLVDLFHPTLRQNAVLAFRAILTPYKISLKQ